MERQLFFDFQTSSRCLFEITTTFFRYRGLLLPSQNHGPPPEIIPRRRRCSAAGSCKIPFTFYPTLLTRCLLIKDTNLVDNSETVYISSLALLKMLRHGRAGVPMEVMGLMLGDFVDDFTVRVVDVFAMPQSGTGVSVEAVDPVFQTKMMEMLRQTGRYVLISTTCSAAGIPWTIFPKSI